MAILLIILFLTGFVTGDQEFLLEETEFFDCAVPDVTNGYINANGVLLAPRAIVLPETEIRLTCWNGTVLLGNGKSTCSITPGNPDQWKPKIGSCIKHQGCGRPPVISGGFVTRNGESSSGATRLIRCYDGYILTGASFVRCGRNMLWSQPGKCIPLPGFAIVEVTQCIVPFVENGQIYTGDGPVLPDSILLANTEVALACKPGYNLTGNSSSFCSNWEGKWVPDIGKCVMDQKCGSTPTIIGGQIERGNSTIGSIRLIKCASDSYLSGRSYIKCLPNATWSQPGYCTATTTWKMPTSYVTQPIQPFMDELKLAVRKGDSFRMLQLLEAGKGVNNITRPPNTYPRFCTNVWNYNDVTPLRLAAACNRSADVLRMLLDDSEVGGAGAVNDVSSAGFTALMYAADNGNDAAVELLLGRGADVNATNHDRYTPLIYAAWSGHNTTVGILLDAGANINAKNRQGYSGLILAAHNGYTDVVCQLVDRGAHIDSRNYLGHSALYYAARFDYTDTARFLMSRGASKRGCRFELCRPPRASSSSVEEHSLF